MIICELIFDKFWRFFEGDVGMRGVIVKPASLYAGFIISGIWRYFVKINNNHFSPVTFLCSKTKLVFGSYTIVFDVFIVYTIRLNIIFII